MSKKDFKGMDHIQTNFKEMVCTRCKARQDIPSMPLEMVNDFFRSFGKLHKKCTGTPPLAVEIEFIPGANRTK